MTGQVATVTPLEAERLVGGGAVLLDVREPDEWEAGHAPGAVHVPLGELGDRLDQLPRDRQIVCVCHLGGRSEKAAIAMARLGYDVANLVGGMEAWSAAGLPVVAAGSDGE